MVLEPLRVREGIAVVITNTSLNLQDLDTQNSELVIVVTRSPEHGKSWQDRVGDRRCLCACVLFCVTSFPLVGISSKELSN